MQVDPMNPKLKAPGTDRLKLKHDERVSIVAFKFNSRLFDEVAQEMPVAAAANEMYKTARRKAGRCSLTHGYRVRCIRI